MNKMKRSFMHIKIMAVVMLLLSACSQEDEYVAKGDNVIPSEGIELTVSATDFVTDGAPDTRATDNGKETTFEEGDRVGVIILDKGGNLLYNNIPYVYKSGNWTFDSNNDDGKGGCYYDTKAKTYIVYYPYSRAADGVKSVDGLKAKFAPKFNQSDIEDYRASDLMVWDRPNSHLPSTEKNLNAKLTHAFASFYLAPTVEKFVLEGGITYKGSYVPEVSDISDVNLTIDNTVYIPYQTKDGTLHCIVPADITPSDIRCFYTFGSKTYGNTISISGKVAVNTRYACEPKIGEVTYSLCNAHVGDFYCKNSNNEGYLIPGDVAPLTYDQKKACVGIVFWVGNEAFQQDPLLKSNHPDCSHGLVVALQDAALNSTPPMYWSKNYELIQNWVKTNDTYKNVVNLQIQDKMCGYSNTLALKAYNKEKGDSNGFRVLPCDAIQQYSKAHPAPENSSDWYFPSVMELKYVCWGQRQGQGTTGRNYLNTQIGVSDGSSFGRDYWSSTEYLGGYANNLVRARYVFFDDGSVHDLDKHEFALRVRPLLAF